MLAILAQLWSGAAGPAVPAVAALCVSDGGGRHGGPAPAGSDHGQACPQCLFPAPTWQAALLPGTPAVPMPRFGSVEADHAASGSPPPPRRVAAQQPRAPPVPS